MFWRADSRYPGPQLFGTFVFFMGPRRLTGYLLACFFTGFAISLFYFAADASSFGEPLSIRTFALAVSVLAAVVALFSLVPTMMRLKKVERDSAGKSTGFTLHGALCGLLGGLTLYFLMSFNQPRGLAIYLPYCLPFIGMMAGTIYYYTVRIFIPSY